MRTPKVGEVVIHHDPNGRAHNALVLCVHTETCINYVIVNPDQDRQDTYGRQIDRLTSMTHKSRHDGVHGFYWRFPDEEPNPYKPPIER